MDVTSLLVSLVTSRLQPDIAVNVSTTIAGHARLPIGSRESGIAWTGYLLSLYIRKDLLNNTDYTHTALVGLQSHTQGSVALHTVIMPFESLQLHSWR